jgi:hypothetical protein
MQGRYGLSGKGRFLSGEDFIFAWRCSMKNRTLLLLVTMLGISTTAWATCTVDVSTSPANPTPTSDVKVKIDLTVPANYQNPVVDVTSMFNVYYVDVVYQCSGCTPGTRTDTFQPPAYPKLDLGKLPCNMYFVVVRVWVNCQICCFPVKMFAGMNSTWFWVKYPCCCW